MAHWLSELIGRKVSPSTGTNMCGVLNKAGEMLEAGESGSIVTLLCDSGERYLDTYFDSAWFVENVGDLSLYRQQLDQFNRSGEWVGSIRLSEVNQRFL